MARAALMINARSGPNGRWRGTDESFPAGPIAILLFAFGFIIYNKDRGEMALAAFTDTGMSRHILRFAINCLVFPGSSAPGATSVCLFSDPMTGVLALVNLLASAMLFPVGLRVPKDYRAQLDAGTEHPVFDPDNFPDLDIDREAWKLDR